VIVTISPDSLIEPWPDFPYFPSKKCGART
jgi:hypothetical protein